MSPWAEIVDEVRARADQRCEYGKMHQSLQGASFHIKHVLPSSRGGPTELANLAFACPSCNLHKSDQTEAADPESGEVVVLFNPRDDAWEEHFQWKDYHVEGLIPRGRATVAKLQLNSPRRRLVRQAEEQFELFPP
jgi:5-methylcytosine-specific restriction endonuclease McrA